MYGHPWGFWAAGHGWFWPGAPLLVRFAIRPIIVGLWLVFGGGLPWLRFREIRAIEILDERYAAGELSTEEYRERRVQLKSW